MYCGGKSLEDNLLEKSIKTRHFIKKFFFFMLPCACYLINRLEAPKLMKAFFHFWYLFNDLKFSTDSVKTHCIPLSNRWTAIRAQSLVIWKPSRGTCSAKDVKARPLLVSQMIRVLSSAPRLDNNTALTRRNLWNVFQFNLHIKHIEVKINKSIGN